MMTRPENQGNERFQQIMIIMMGPETQGKHHVAMNDDNGANISSK